MGNFTKLPIGKCLAHLAVGLACVEAVARLACGLVGTKLHQPFLVSVRKGPAGMATHDQPLRWMTNERGARGDLYRGQSVRIAVFGSSTSSGAFLDQPQTWPEQVRRQLGPDRVHIDNFAIDGGTGPEAIRLMNSLRGERPKYDIALIQFHATVKVGSSGYSASWMGGGPLKCVSSFPALAEQQLRREPQLKRLFQFASRFWSTPGIQRLDISNRELRNNGKVKLVYAPPPTDAEAVQDRTRRLIDAASRIAKRVILVTQPIAHSPDASPAVARKWITLRPVEGKHDEFLDNQSIAESVRRGQSVMAAVANEKAVEIINLDDVILPWLSKTDELFDDKWHPTPRGAALIGETVAAYLRQPDLQPADLPPRLPSSDPKVDNVFEMSVDSSRN